MSAKLTRREHIIPRMLLSEFAGTDGSLWVYAKGATPRRGRPENECVEKDFFEFELRGKKTNNSYENWLSQIEGQGASLLNSIRNRSQFDDQSAFKWSEFVASLFGRTRKVRAQISEGMKERFRDQTENPEFIRDLQYSLLRKGELHYADDLKAAVTGFCTAMDSSPSFYHVSALPNRTRIIVESLMQRAWHTIEAAPGTSFLCSDCPVVTYEVVNGQPHPGSGFGNQNTVAMLPVGSKHLWVASPHHLNWRMQATDAGMTNINRLIVQFAHRNVYADTQSEEIRTLVDTEINTLVFGKNAFVPPNRANGQTE
jgi:hypothetical protein